MFYILFGLDIIQTNLFHIIVLIYTFCFININMNYNGYYFFFWKYLLRRIKFVRVGTKNAVKATVQSTM